MPVRRNIITGHEILFAPERAGRPNAFGRESAATCPFCPGQEAGTPPEITRRGQPWRVRVFPNKYPAVEGHEVIVESPRHEETFDRIGHADEVVAVYLERYAAHRSAAYVSLFRNQGERAGASIDHLHSQVMPLPFVPHRAEREAAAFAGANACPLCARNEVVVDENEAFRWISPHGSSQNYQQWIMPRRHVAEMTELSAAELRALADLLRRAIGATNSISSAHNLAFLNFPRSPKAHFYVDLFPRMTPVAGFELGTGTFIDVIDPDSAARRLRNAAAH